MLVVHDVQRIIRHDHAVSGSEAGLHIFGIVQLLLDQDDRVRAVLLGLLNQLQREGCVAVGAFLHLTVEIGEIFSGIFGLHAQCLAELVLAEAVGISALGGKIAAFILIVLAEPCRRWAVQPPVGRGSGEKRMFTHGPGPPHLRPAPCNLPGQSRRAYGPHTFEEGHEFER